MSMHETAKDAIYNRVVELAPDADAEDLYKLANVVGNATYGFEGGLTVTRKEKETKDETSALHVPESWTRNEHG